MRRSYFALMAMGLLVVLTSCSGSQRMEQPPHFGVGTAIITPRDEAGGRFDGARLSSGFGILYLNGFTSGQTTQTACEGYVTEEPEHLIEVSYAMRFKLELHSEEDLVLAVLDPDGTWICGDEPSAINANVALTREFEPGTYEIWVGERRENTSTAYRLIFSE